MRLLYDNYLKDSSLTASSENSLYPVENIVHKFLEKKYRSLLYLASITVVFPEDREVDTIALAYTNVTTATYTALTASRATLQTGNLEFDNDTNITYIEPVTCRSIVFDFQATGSVQVGGMSAGVSKEYTIVQANPQLPMNSRGNMEQTNGGQVLGRNYKSLRSWVVAITDMTNELRLFTEQVIYSSGLVNPVYVDLYENNHGEEPPMHAIIDNIGNSRRDTKSGTYTMGLAFQEAR